MLAVKAFQSVSPVQPSKSSRALWPRTGWLFQTSFSPLRMNRMICEFRPLLVAPP